MTAMDLELGVFTRRQVDDHMFVLKEIETRRSQIKFLDFCNVNCCSQIEMREISACTANSCTPSGYREYYEANSGLSQDFYNPEVADCSSQYLEGIL